MLLQTNSYIVPKDRRVEHQRLLRRFRQTLERLGCEHFEVYEQVGTNWSSGDNSGRFVQIMRFRDRRQQQAVQAAERADPGAQAVIAEFCNLINFPYQQQQGLFAVGFYTSTLPVSMRRSLPPPVDSIEETLSDEGEADETELDEILESVEGEDPAEDSEVEASDEAYISEEDDRSESVDEETAENDSVGAEEPADAADETEEEPLAIGELLTEDEAVAEDERPAEDEASDEALSDGELETVDLTAEPDSEPELPGEAVGEGGELEDQPELEAELLPSTEDTSVPLDVVALDLEEEGLDPQAGELDIELLSVEEESINDLTTGTADFRPQSIQAAPEGRDETDIATRPVSEPESELELDSVEESGLEALLSSEQFLTGLDADHFASPATKDASAGPDHDESHLYAEPTANRNGHSLSSHSSGPNGASGNGEHAVGPRQGRFQS